MSQPFFQVNCRRVHSEILESVSKIKCSILGRKGGLLYSYGHFGSEAAINESGKESKRGRRGIITIMSDFSLTSLQFQVVMEAHLAMVSQAVPPTPPPPKRVQEERLVVEGTNPTQLPSHSLRQLETGYMITCTLR